MFENAKFRSIKEAWEMYKGHVIPEEASENQVTETKRAFYAGCSAAMEVTGRCFQEATNEDEAEKFINSLYDEIEVFLSDVQSGRA